MATETSSSTDRRGDMIQLLPRLIAYARGLGCSEEDAPALIRDMMLAELEEGSPDASPEEIEAVLRREIGIRCLQTGALTDRPEGGSSSDYLEGIRLAQKELQRNLEALGRIDPSLRRIFVLRVINHEGFGDIARTLGLTVRGVKARLERAMREIAAMRRGTRVGATLRGPASARLAAAGAKASRDAGARRPSKSGEEGGDGGAIAGAAGKMPVLPLPVAGLRLVHGGKKWGGPDML